MTMEGFNNKFRINQNELIFNLRSKLNQILGFELSEAGFKEAIKSSNFENLGKKFGTPLTQRAFEKVLINKLSEFTYF